MSHGHFCDNQFLSITDCNIIHIVLKHLQSSVPERIIRQSDIIEVLSSFHIMVKPVTIQCIVSAIVQMNHKRNIRLYLTAGTNSRADKFCNIIVIWQLSFRPQKTVGKLISNLDHSYIHAGIQYFLKGIFCEIIYCFFQFFHAVRSPCLWLDLFSRVCPEITVVEVEQYPQSGICHSFSDRNRFCQIVVSGTVRLSTF